MPLDTSAPEFFDETLARDVESVVTGAQQKMNAWIDDKVNTLVSKMEAQTQQAAEALKAQSAAIDEAYHQMDVTVSKLMDQITKTSVTFNDDRLKAATEALAKDLKAAQDEIAAKRDQWRSAGSQSVALAAGFLRTAIKSVV